MRQQTWEPLSRIDLFGVWLLRSLVHVQPGRKGTLLLKVPVPPSLRSPVIIDQDLFFL